MFQLVDMDSCCAMSKRLNLSSRRVSVPGVTMKSDWNRKIILTPPLFCSPCTEPRYTFLIVYSFSIEGAFYPVLSGMIVLNHNMKLLQKNKAVSLIKKDQVKKYSLCRLCVVGDKLFLFWSESPSHLLSSEKTWSFSAFFRSLNQRVRRAHSEAFLKYDSYLPRTPTSCSWEF